MGPGPHNLAQSPKYELVVKYYAELKHKKLSAKLCRDHKIDPESPLPAPIPDFSRGPMCRKKTSLIELGVSEN